MIEPPSFLSFGSNLGNREESVLAALRLVEASGAAKIIACSGLYETAPVEAVGGDYFINAVAEVRPLLCPPDLLKRLKSIEKKLNRTGGHNRPREIDIDIVSLGVKIIDNADLVVPHPRYADRAFVLLPLQEIAPDYECPLAGRSIEEMIRSLRSFGEKQDVVRVSGRFIVDTSAR